MAAVHTFFGHMTLEVVFADGLLIVKIHSIFRWLHTSHILGVSVLPMYLCARLVFAVRM